MRWVICGLGLVSVLVRAQSLPSLPPIAPTDEPQLAAQALQRVEVIAGESTDDDLRRRESIAKAVYGREELDRHGDIDLTDVLKRLPGVTMEGSAPRLRGLGGGYTQVLINGEPAPPGFSLESLAPGDAERIEIIKGATAEYSGVAGTINIVLRETPKSRQREWRGNVAYRAIRPMGGTSFQWGDRIGDISYVVPANFIDSTQATHFHTQRTSRTSLGEVRSQAVNGVDRNQNQSVTLSPRLQWKLGDTDTLSINSFFQHSEPGGISERMIDALAGTPPLTTRELSQSNSRQNVSRMQLQWQRKSPDSGRIELKYGWQKSANHHLANYDGWRVDNALNLNRQTLSDFEDQRQFMGGRWNFRVGDAHALVAGWDIDQRQHLELRRTIENGVERTGPVDSVPFAAQINRVVGFVQDELVLTERCSLLPGLRLEHITTRSHSAGAEVENRAHLFAPVMHLNYRLDSTGKDQIRTSVTRSFKLPELSSLLSRYVLNTTYERDTPNTPLAADRAGNPLLRPELATGFDIAFEHYPKSGGVISIGLFDRHIDGLIRSRIGLETVPDSNVLRWVSRPVNLGRARSQGLELEVKGQAEELLPSVFADATNIQLRANLNRYRSHVEQVDGPENRLEGQPPWAATLGIDARIRDSGWTVGGSLVLRPSYATQQTDRQHVRRSVVRTLDTFVLLKIDRTIQLRLALSNLLAPASITSNEVEDLDGFTARSETRRETLRAVNLSLVARF